MTTRAALLDEQGVYLRMDELTDPADLTVRHLPQITACDLQSGQYVWLPKGAPLAPEIAAAVGAARDNEYGGAFFALKWLARVERDAKDVKAAKEANARLETRRAARKAERETEEAKRREGRA
jgi:hypothetical protein